MNGTRDNKVGLRDKTAEGMVERKLDSIISIGI